MSSQPTDSPRQVAIVTGVGSSEGIGFATALLLAERGVALVVTSTTARIDDRVAELKGRGADVLGVIADLTIADSAAALVETALAEFGHLDALINNAGMTSISGAAVGGSISELSDHDWHTALDRNLDTMFYMTRAASRPMIDRGYGRIVNMASVSGPIMAFPADVGYHTAKAGVVGLTRSVALDLAPHGITANAVAPGWIATASSTERELRLGKATPSGRSGGAHEVASVMAFLASPEASYITGQLITIDGGNSLAEERLALD